jgi:hypothetical protein
MIQDLTPVHVSVSRRTERRTGGQEGLEVSTIGVDKPEGAPIITWTGTHKGQLFSVGRPAQLLNGAGSSPFANESLRVLKRWRCHYPDPIISSIG